MRRPTRLPALTALLSILAAPALAQTAAPAVPAILEGHAVLPAETILKAPGDAPGALKISGKYTGPDGRRSDAVGSIPGRTGTGESARTTGVNAPFRGQPLQGISSLRAAGDGIWWGLTDNGYGAKGNSADAMVGVHQLRTDWRSGKVAHLGTVWLSDPDRLMPWPITMEASRTRYLTGADIDPESMVVTPDGFWVSDEFGPWLLRFDPDGKLTGLWETVVEGKPVRSPDHPSVRAPGTPDGRSIFEVGRSRGLEGLTASPDGRHLYALMEGPVWREGKPETFADGKPRLRLLEFDTTLDNGTGGWTGRNWTYTLESEGNAIGEITWIDRNRALVIERDGGEGDAARACPDANKPAPDCFTRPARFKRLYLVTRSEVKEGGALRKLGYVDLLAVNDPNGVALRGGANGKFSFPFVTIESVEPAGDGRVVVVNDNNLPFSAGRALDRADDTEFIRLDLSALLALN